MSTTPPDGPDERSIAENAARIASESLTHYDEASDTYHCSYGPPVPAVTVHDTENQVLVRVEPSSGTVVGFSIPQFRSWHAEHADEDGTFEISLPSRWPLGDDQDASTDA